MQLPYNKTEQDKSTTTGCSRRSLLRQTALGTAALTLGTPSLESSNAEAANDASQSRTQFSVQTLLTGVSIGCTVALSADGHTALVDSPSGDTTNIWSTGEAYVFNLKAGEWTYTQTLANPNPEYRDNFGREMVLSSDGRTALITSTNGFDTRTDEVDVFTLNAGKWTHTQTLSGSSVALSANGRTALIDTQLYTISESGWTPVDTLSNPESDDNDDFGSSVALSANGRTAIVGATGADDRVGEAYVFTLTADSATLVDTLSNPDPTTEDYFGGEVALSTDGRTALVAAAHDDGFGGIGEVYEFARTSTGWTHTSTISHPDPEERDYFGRTMALSGDGRTVLIGTPGIPGDQTGFPLGAVYVFARTPSEWTHVDTVVHPDPDRYEPLAFTNDLALSANGRTALIGTLSGEAYVFTDGRRHGSDSEKSGTD